MVATPSSYLVAAAVALVALQMREASATSLYYDPVTAENATESLCNSHPAFGGYVDESKIEVIVEVDPELPDISTIANVTVTYPELLANTSGPVDSVVTEVGTSIYSNNETVTSGQEDTYTSTSTSTSTTTTSTTSTSTSTTSTTTSTQSSTKTGISSVGDESADDESVDDESADDDACDPGFGRARKLRGTEMSGRKLEEKLTRKRALEELTNEDITKLETFFGSSMEMNLASLPTQGVFTPSPWPGPYWPTYQDSINVVWSSGEPSAAEKYATAFGLDVTEFMDAVSADNGIDSMSSHTACTSDDDCSDLTDGSTCSIRADASSGYCIPTWYGICHAWTPASMLEDEPSCAVTYNGVTFQPLDIKALLSDLYDGASISTVFTGSRYNGGTDSLDEYGRHTSDSYRDLNPAFFHIAAANILGNLESTFIVDTTAGSEVWNQPVRGFKVYEQQNMTTEEAAETFYGLESYPFNSRAESIVYVKTRLSWIVETYTDGALVSTGLVDSYTTGAYYTYLLEMDSNGDIIGGEWVYDSDDTHPDFLWFPTAKPADDTVTSIGLSYADVKTLLEMSVNCDGSASSSTESSASGSSSVDVGEEDSSSASFFEDSSMESSSPDAGESSDGGPMTVSTEEPTVGSEEGSWSSSTSAPSSYGAESEAGFGTSAPVTEVPETTSSEDRDVETPATETPAATESPATEAPATTTEAPASTQSSGGNGQFDYSSHQSQSQKQHQYQYQQQGNVHSY